MSQWGSFSGFPYQPDWASPNCWFCIRTPSISSRLPQSTLPMLVYFTFLKKLCWKVETDWGITTPRTAAAWVVAAKFQNPIAAKPLSASFFKANGCVVPLCRFRLPLQFVPCKEDCKQSWACLQIRAKCGGCGFLLVSLAKKKGTLKTRHANLMVDTDVDFTLPVYNESPPFGASCPTASGFKLWGAMASLGSRRVLFSVPEFGGHTIKRC